MKFGVVFEDEILMPRSGRTRREARTMTFQGFTRDIARAERGAIEVSQGQINEVVRRVFLLARQMPAAELYALMKSARTVGKADTTPKRPRRLRRSQT